MQHLIEVSEKFSNISFTGEDNVLMARDPKFITPNFHRVYLLIDREKVNLDRVFMSEIINSPSDRQNWEDFDQYKKRMKLRNVLKQLEYKIIKYFLNN